MKRIGTILLGSLLAVGGLASAGFGLVRAFGAGAAEARFLTGTTMIPIGVMLLELGLAAIWLTLRAVPGGGRPATLPPWWATAIVYAVAVGGGFAALRFAVWWAFFPLATIAVFAPIAATGRLGMPTRGVRPPWAPLLAAFAWGALVAPALAIVAELAATVVVGVAVYYGLSLGGQESPQLLLDTWRFYLQGRSIDGEQVTTLLQFALRQPFVLVAAASIFVVTAPGVEEILKALAIPIFARTRPQANGAAIDTPLTIFLIGLASGLGFAATENIFYVAQSGEQGWVVMALFRGITPLMHGTATALFALGWARQAQRPRGWALLWGALASLGLHAAWNLCAGLMFVASAFATGVGNTATLAGLLLLLSVGVLGGLALLSAGILLRQRRTLAMPSEVAVATRPAAAGIDGYAPAPYGEPIAERGEPVRAGRE